MFIQLFYNIFELEMGEHAKALRFLELFTLELNIYLFSVAKNKYIVCSNKFVHCCTDRETCGEHLF